MIQYLELLAKQYNVDKWEHGFIEIYSNYFHHQRESIKTLLEIGVYKGDSLKMWADYFSCAKIYGWDLKPYTLNEFGINISTFLVNQEDRASIEKFLSVLGKEKIKFDVIIDDGGHTMQGQQCTLAVLWRHLSPGGMYIVEDLHTSLPHNTHEWRGGGCLPDFSNSSLRALQNLQNTGKMASIYMTEAEQQMISDECSACRVFDTRNDERHITSVLIKKGVLK
jgi:hypothetical protein